MFRKMRRKDKALSKDDAIKMLESSSYGTLAINGENGYPYSVPVSFGYDDDTIYFHSANAGLKYDCLKKDGKVSFSIVEKDDVQPSEFTTIYRSMIAYGTCRELADPEEIKKALATIIDKYSKGFEKEGEAYTKKYEGKFAVYGISIEHLTAKGK